MERLNASDAADVRLVDPFRTVADSHRADVRKIRERNRMRRLRYMLYLNVLILAYLVKRGLEGRPLEFGLPSLGADDWLWLFPVLMILMLGSVLMLPLINGRSPHIRFSPEQLGIGFQDVKGIDVVLEEVTRTLQIFLAYRSFREELGGNPRRGVLFEGKPGTGKTHLAKAMASEAGVPFFFVSAPAFQSMWAGMTAWKIRAFFKALKKAARKEGGAIGFIEEIDAVGGARGGLDRHANYARGGLDRHANYAGGGLDRHANSAGGGLDRFGGHESRDLDLNAGSGSMTVNPFIDTGNGGMVNELLIQMQSFDAPLLGGRIRNWFTDLVNLFLPALHQVKKKKIQYNNVLVIAATNRSDQLDPALMRPGRFDRALYFDLPSRAGRRDLIDYFLERRSHEPEMDRHDLREELSLMTLGYTPAMLEHILDEALVWAVRDSRNSLNWKDVQRARLSEEIGLGQPVAYSEREKLSIATHEAGHAVVAYLCGKDRKLEVLSIIKRRSALGLLAHSDLEERFTRTKSELESTLQITLGGLVAEELFFGEHGTGPSSDLTTATSLAAQMIGAFGMGHNLISFEAVQDGAFSSSNIVGKVLATEAGRTEVEDLLRRLKSEVTSILGENRHLIQALRDELLVREELLGDEILRVLENA